MSTCNALKFERKKNRRENVRKINFVYNVVCRKKKKDSLLLACLLTLSYLIFPFSHVGDGLTDSLRGLSSTEVVINVICSVLFCFLQDFIRSLVLQIDLPFFLESIASSSSSIFFVNFHTFDCLKYWCNILFPSLNLNLKLNGSCRWRVLLNGGISTTNHISKSYFMKSDILCIV